MLFLCTSHLDNSVVGFFLFFQIIICVVAVAAEGALTNSEFALFCQVFINFH